MQYLYTIPHDDETGACDPLVGLLLVVQNHVIVVSSEKPGITSLQASYCYGPLPNGDTWRIECESGYVWQKRSYTDFVRALLAFPEVIGDGAIRWSLFTSWSYSYTHWLLPNPVEPENMQNSAVYSTWRNSGTTNRWEFGVASWVVEDGQGQIVHDWMPWVSVSAYNESTGQWHSKIQMWEGNGFQYLTGDPIHCNMEINVMPSEVDTQGIIDAINDLNTTGALGTIATALGSILTAISVGGGMYVLLEGLLAPLAHVVTALSSAGMWSELRALREALENVVPTLESVDQTLFGTATALRAQIDASLTSQVGEPLGLLHGGQSTMTAGITNIRQGLDNIDGRLHADVDGDDLQENITEVIYGAVGSGGGGMTPEQFDTLVSAIEGISLSPGSAGTFDQAALSAVLAKYFWSPSSEMNVAQFIESLINTGWVIYK